MMIVSVAMLAVSQTLTWQRGGNESIICSWQEIQISFSLPVVTFLQHMYTNIYNPPIHYIFENETNIRFY